MKHIDRITDAMTPSPMAIAVSRLMEEFLEERRKYSRSMRTTRNQYALSHLPEPTASASTAGVTKFTSNASVINYTSSDADSDMKLIMQTAALKMVSRIYSPGCRLQHMVDVLMQVQRHTNNCHVRSYIR